MTAVAVVGIIALVLAGLAVLAVGVVLVRELPGIRRYLRIRRM